MADFEPENIASSNGLRLRIKGKVQGSDFVPTFGCWPGALTCAARSAMTAPG